MIITNNELLLIIGLLRKHMEKSQDYEVGKLIDKLESIRRDGDNVVG